MIDLNKFSDTRTPRAAPADPIGAFLGDMQKNGITCQDPIHSDGKIHRFAPNGNRKDKSGWYILHLDADFAAGCFGDWKNSDGSHKWCSVSEHELDPAQQKRYRDRQALIEKQLLDGYETAARDCKKAWDEASPAADAFPYLAKKNVPSHGLRVHADGYLMIPMMNITGQIESLQRIYPDGSKYNWTGGKKQGNSFAIPGDQAEIYICEGYATGATIHQATGAMVIVAFDAGNLYSVTANIRTKYPTSRVTICADNDQWKPDKGNTGVTKAQAVGSAFGVKVLWPEFKATTDTRPTDFNDLANLEGIDEVKKQIKECSNLDPWEGQIFTLKDAYAPREPLQFIVSGLLTLPSLSIVYGAPGTLKSMLLADMAVCVAAGKTWLSRTVIQSPVMWIDLDNGQRRTHERFSALARSRSLPDNTPLYYVSMPMPWLNAEKPEDIESLSNRIIKNNIKLVCIDNLGLISMSSEEKSDAMIPIMANLRLITENTGAAISIIHHQRKGTTVNSRAGDSLRGHSGIEGAIDLALLVTREESGNYVTIQSTKTRDVEVLPFMAEFRYDHQLGTNELQQASFVKIELEDNTSDKAVEKVILKICTDDVITNQKQVVSLARKQLNVGVNRIRHIYKQLKDSKRIAVYVSDDE